MGFDSVPPPPTIIKPAEEKTNLPPAILKKIDEQAQGFEAMFMGQMMQFMHAGVETNQEFGGGAGEETWRGMMIEEYGRLSSQTGNLGIAAAVKAEMIKAQEKIYGLHAQPTNPNGETQ